MNFDGRGISAFIDAFPDCTEIILVGIAEIRLNAGNIADVVGFYLDA